jgi:microcystin-dependent protein
MILVSNFRENQYPEVEGTRCVQVFMPDDDAFIALIANLLNLPGNEQNYVGIDPELVASLAEQWRNAYVQTDWMDCNTVTIPIGAIISSISDTPDEKWLLCDGTTYLRADYPLLAAILPEGTLNLGGDADEFVVPNLIGRVIAGAGSGAVSPATSITEYSYGGKPTHILTSDEMPIHNHDVYSADKYTAVQAGAGGGAAPNGAGVLTSLKTGNAGNGQAHTNMQPYMGLYYWIYAGE